MSKHRRAGRRILNNARRNWVNDSAEGINGHASAITFMQEISIRKICIIVLCLVIAGSLIVLAPSNIPSTIQNHVAPVCTHECGIGCLSTPESGLLSEVFVREEVDGFVNVSTREYLNADIRSFASYNRVDDEDDSLSLHPNIVYNEESIYSEDVEDFESVDNSAIIYHPNHMTTISETSVPRAMFYEDELVVEGYTLTIVIKTHGDGMAIGLQNGEMLSINPLIPSEEEYEIGEVVSGERFVITAGPHEENHFVHWTAFLTDDITQSLPLNLQATEPPVSTCIFVMPEADVTIVIEFTHERPEYLDYSFIIPQIVPDGIIPDASNIPVLLPIE